MATVMDPTREFSECPWCHTPGRLFLQDEDLVNSLLVKYRVACPNEKCKVRPRTKKYNNIDMNRAAALNMAINDWESR